MQFLLSYLRYRLTKGNNRRRYGVAWHVFAKTAEHHFATLNQGFYFLLGLGNFLQLPLYFKTRKKLTVAKFSEFDFRLKIFRVQNLKNRRLIKKTHWHVGDPVKICV